MIIESLTSTAYSVVVHELLVHFGELLEVVLQELNLLLLRRAAAQRIAAAAHLGRLVRGARAVEFRAGTLYGVRRSEHKAERRVESIKRLRVKSVPV